MSVPVKATPAGEIMEAVLLKGDLKKLTPEERVRYYNETCRSIGLNPLTKPFEYIELNGKLTLYARRDAADQLRKINGINIAIVSQEMHDGLLSIHVRATDRDGRIDEDLGVVNFPDTLRGEIRANAIMKAVTKAKRRVTLSISGLGFLDETEVEDIPNGEKRINPHVVRPEDVTEVPAEGHPDRLPAGDPDIKSLPKKDARKDFSEMQTELYAIKDIEKLQRWGKASANRIATFPLDWQQIFRGLYVGHLTALRAQPAEAPEADWLTELDIAFQNCEDAASFFEVDKKMFLPIIPTVSPEERRKAQEIRQEHFARISGET